jgi:hypothetical protein
VSDVFAAGDRVFLVERPTGWDSGEYPLTVGKLYVVESLDGSNLRVNCDDPDIGTVSVARTRFRLVTAWAKTDEGDHWECYSDGVRFRFSRAGRGWIGKAYFDGDEVSTTCAIRERGLAELYELVRANRQNAEAARRADRL